MPPADAKPTMVLDAAALRRLAADPRVAAEFPFLVAVLRPAPAGCCGGAGRSPDPGPVVRAVFDLPPARKARLKTLLGVGRVTGDVVRALRLVRETF